MKRIFMQDGARAHTALATRDFLDKHNVEVVPDHPASSPDLNPIESLWAELNRRIADMMPHDEESLVEAAYDAWASFSQDEIDAFVRKFTSSCQTVVDNGM